MDYILVRDADDEDWRPLKSQASHSVEGQISKASQSSSAAMRAAES